MENPFSLMINVEHYNLQNELLNEWMSLVQSNKGFKCI